MRVKILKDLFDSDDQELLVPKDAEAEVFTEDQEGVIIIWRDDFVAVGIEEFVVVADANN